MVDWLKIKAKLLFVMIICLLIGLLLMKFCISWGISNDTTKICYHSRFVCFLRNILGDLAAVIAGLSFVVAFLSLYILVLKKPFEFIYFLFIKLPEKYENNKPILSLLLIFYIGMFIFSILMLPYGINHFEEINTAFGDTVYLIAWALLFMLSCASVFHSFILLIFGKKFIEAFDDKNKSEEGKKLINSVDNIVKKTEFATLFEEDK